MKTYKQNRLVPDPSMSDSEFLFRQAQERDRAQRVGVKPNLDVGRVWAEENAMARIGALCHVRKRQPHHERAAEEFKSLYEARYGGMGSAVDPSRVQVDTSPIAHDSGMAAKLDRTAKLEHAMATLSKISLDRITACVILGIACADQSTMMKSGQANQRHVGRCVDETLAAFDELAELWQMKTQARAA